MRFRPTTLDRRDFLALGGAFLLAAGASNYAQGAPALTVLSGSAFGTHWSVSLPAGSHFAGLPERLDALLAHLDLAFSPWRADSVVARFNSGAARDMAVSDEIADVTRSALAIARASNGAFDPTVGPLVARWGFGPIHGNSSRSQSWLGLSADNAHIAKADSDLTLDLCGIAKGHAVDRMVVLLLDAGHQNFLIDVGGELAARGRHPSGRIWQVGIEHPLPGRGDIAGVLRLANVAVATSGDRANGYDIGRRRYSHIIDPVNARTRRQQAGIGFGADGDRPRSRRLGDDPDVGWSGGPRSCASSGPLRLVPVPRRTEPAQHPHRRFPASFRRGRLMEALLAVVIVCLAGAGLGVGLMLGRGAPRRSCDGLACIGGTRCDGCPHAPEESAP